MRHPSLSSRQAVLFEVRHRLPGRTRLRVPALGRAPHLEPWIAAALRRIDGVHRVRPNAACASMVLHHAVEATPTPEAIDGALRSVLALRQAVAQVPGKKALLPANSESKAPGRAPPAGRSFLGACPICRLKLETVRWILTDLWRCWREHWARRLQTRLTAAMALFRP